MSGQKIMKKEIKMTHINISGLCVYSLKNIMKDLRENILPRLKLYVLCCDVDHISMTRQVVAESCYHDYNQKRAWSLPKSSDYSLLIFISQI